jgi:hypothetical protein
MEVSEPVGASDGECWNQLACCHVGCNLNYLSDSYRANLLHRLREINFWA